MPTIVDQEWRFNRLSTADRIALGASLTSPLTFSPASIGGNPQIAPAFSIAQSLPSGVSGLSSSDGQTVTASLGLLGACTFTWTNPPTNGSIVTVNGTFEF